MFLLGSFAVVALLLATLGIYGVMSYSVAQRTREIGIRMALGARRTDVLQMTVKEGLKLVGAGMLARSGCSIYSDASYGDFALWDQCKDPITFVGISLMLLAVAILASYIPAVRATKVNPIVALRVQ
jgi:ABC-type antimicrobial peptide transport system permease subunit